jgi:hypothetical protein
MFFVIDFETSALTPWEGIPLTLGIVPVTQDGDILTDSTGYFEFPILADYVPDWNYPGNFDPGSTNAFWHNLFMEESPAFDAAWGIDNDRTILSVGWYNERLQETVSNINYYLSSVEEVKMERFLCANPISFDKMWMDSLFAKFQLPAPYHYRSLCLRSMRYGLQYKFDRTYGSARSNHQPTVEHHALDDALAEAKDLVELMEIADGKIIL